MASVALRAAWLYSNALGQRWASAAAVVPLSSAISYPYARVRSPSEARPSAEVQVTKIANGVTVASVEKVSPFSSVCVYVRGGSRAEAYSQQGLAHFMSVCAPLSTKDKSSFLLTREIDFLGGSFSASTTREHQTYSSTFLRGNLPSVMTNLCSMVANPEFLHFEVAGQYEKLKLESEQALSQPNNVVTEQLHKTSFRNALSNSLFCPSHNVKRFTQEDLKSYHEENYTGSRTIVVGVGIDHAELVNQAEKNLRSIREVLSKKDEVADYVGGYEVRIETGSPLAHAAIVCKGMSFSSQPKDIASAGVLQHLLGAGSYVKWGSQSISRLGKAVATAVNAPFVVHSLNYSYSDNGLFGMFGACDGAVMGRVFRAMVVEFSEVAKGNFTEEELTRAKNQLKSSYLTNTETNLGLARDIVQQISLKGSYSPVPEAMSAVDSVSSQDVIRIAKMIFGTHPNLVAHGNLSSLPRVDQLLSGVSVK